MGMASTSGLQLSLDGPDDLSGLVAGDAVAVLAHGVLQQVAGETSGLAEHAMGVFREDVPGRAWSGTRGGWFRPRGLARITIR